MDKLKALYKYASSFYKGTWDLEDYPVRLKQQGRDDPKIPMWSAQVINWWVLSGLGSTKKEAYESLRESLNAAKESRDCLPRPGTKVPIEFESGDEIDKYWAVASRLIDEVLGHNPEDVFVSDGSSLWDFTGEDSLKEYYDKIHQVFGVDVSHIESGNLVEISRFVSENI